MDQDGRQPPINSPLVSPTDGTAKRPGAVCRSSAITGTVVVALALLAIAGLPALDTNAFAQPWQPGGEAKPGKSSKPVAQGLPLRPIYFLLNDVLGFSFSAHHYPSGSSGESTLSINTFNANKTITFYPRAIFCSRIRVSIELAGPTPLHSVRKKAAPDTFVFDPESQLDTRVGVQDFRVALEHSAVPSSTAANEADRCGERAQWFTIRADPDSATSNLATWLPQYFQFLSSNLDPRISGHDFRTVRRLRVQLCGQDLECRNVCLKLSDYPVEPAGQKTEVCSKLLIDDRGALASATVDTIDVSHSMQ